MAKRICSKFGYIIRWNALTKVIRSNFGAWQSSAVLTCLATDACLTADPVVASLIPSQSYTFLRLIMKKFYGHSPPFCLIIQEGSVTVESLS